MGGSSSKTETLRQLNEAVAQVITDVTLQCGNTIQNLQNLTVKCRPNQAQIDELKARNLPYEDNQACRSCIQGILDTKKGEYQLQRNLWGRHSAQINKPIDKDYEEIVTSAIRCGTSFCKACSIQNISQKTTINGTANCQSLNQINNAVDQKLSEKVIQGLRDHQNALSPLATALGGGSDQDVATELVSRVSSRITDTVISNIRQQIDNVQTLTFDTEGSFLANGNSQNSAITSATNYLSQNQVFNNILTDQQWDTFQKLLNEDKDPLSAGGEFVAKNLGFLDKAAKSVLGRAFIGIVAVCIAAIVGLVIYIYYRKRQHEQNMEEGEDVDNDEDY